jgi:N-acetyl-anhydromuramyl-L-alanine amidase AmpD
MALSFNKDFRLPENQYNKGNFKKSGICVHHTVGSTAESTFHWWNGNSDKVGTAYIIDRDGTLLEVFDPESWAWQFGLKWNNPDRFAFERRFIGIELASEGGLKEKDGKFYCFDRISPRTEKPEDEVFDAGENYRGHRYFDRYEPEQMETLTELINHLCDRFDIPRKMLAKPTEYYGQEIKNFKGIIGHVNVRKDKTDPAPIPELWETLKNKCHLSVEGAELETGSVERPVPAKMSTDKIDDLFNHNVEELNKMHVPAGSMVKGLIMELERKNRNTYIKLRDAEPDGHICFYDFVEGDKELLKKVGLALGFKQVTPTKLEVHNA